MSPLGDHGAATDQHKFGPTDAADSGALYQATGRRWIKFLKTLAGSASSSSSSDDSRVQLHWLDTGPLKGSLQRIRTFYSSLFPKYLRTHGDSPGEAEEDSPAVLPGNGLEQLRIISLRRMLRCSRFFPSGCCLDPPLDRILFDHPSIA